jgi:Subtilase family
MTSVWTSVKGLAALIAVASVTACSSSLQQTSLPDTQPQAVSQGQAPSTGASADDTAAPDSDSEDAPVSGSGEAPVSGPEASTTPSLAPGRRAAAGSAAAQQSSSLPAISALRYVCRHPAQAGRRECDAIVRTDTGGARSDGYHGSALSQAFSRAAGRNCNHSAPYCASDLQAAYGLSAIAKNAGRGSIVAVVDAYGYPNASADLAVYRKSMGLPACTVATGCLKIVNQSGQAGPLPKPNSDPSDDWRPEEALDLDMVSAICPNCKIVLVQTNTNRASDLAAGVNAAVGRGAIAISNSYSGMEEDAANSAYQHSGRAITASAGDSGTGPRAPCSYAGVVCVGGTSLLATSFGRGWSERAWRLTGSGCSAFVSKPQWQRQKGCPKRAEADISAVADPSTGVAFYESAAGGWMQIGGTSVSSPIVAAVFALGPSAGRANAPQWIWRHGGSSAYHDVTSGSNGECSILYLCHAREGYDGPTGWGTPAGISGF